jgi:hypothetical protein
MIDIKIFYVVWTVMRPRSRIYAGCRSSRGRPYKVTPWNWLEFSGIFEIFNLKLINLRLNCR